MKYTDMQWRVGSQERRTIYAVIPQKHEEEHPLIGVMDDEFLAANVVASHNRTLVLLTFSEKEQLIKDLAQTQAIMKGVDQDVPFESAIVQVTQDRLRSERVYKAIGLSVDILQTTEPNVVLTHAIERIRSQ